MLNCSNERSGDWGDKAQLIIREWDGCSAGGKTVLVVVADGSPTRLSQSPFEQFQSKLIIYVELDYVPYLNMSIITIRKHGVWY